MTAVRSRVRVVEQHLAFNVGFDALQPKTRPANTCAWWWMSCLYDKSDMLTDERCRRGRMMPGGGGCSSLSRSVRLRGDGNVDVMGEVFVCPVGPPKQLLDGRCVA